MIEGIPVEEVALIVIGIEKLEIGIVATAKPGRPIGSTPVLPVFRAPEDAIWVQLRPEAGLEITLPLISWEVVFPEVLSEVPVWLAPEPTSALAPVSNPVPVPVPA